MTCPLMPWARATRPTRSSPSLEASPGSGPTHHPQRHLLVVVAELQRGLRPFQVGGRVHECPHGSGRSPLPTDDPPQIPLRHEQFHERLALVLTLGDPNGLRAVRQRPGDDFDDVAAAAHDADGAAAGSAGAGGIRATRVRIVSDGTAPALIQ